MRNHDSDANWFEKWLNGEMKRARAKFLSFIMSTKLYSWLMRDVVPQIRFSFNKTSFTGKKYHDGYSRLLRGHMILTSDKRRLVSLVPGIVDHCAVCVGTRLTWPRDTEIREMTHTDYTKSDFFDLCHESERVIIVECVDWAFAYMNEVLRVIELDFGNAKYDQQFEFGLKALYCSEMPYLADQIVAQRFGVKPKLKVSVEDLLGIGRPYISPMGILCGENIRCVWDSDGQFTGMMGPEIRKILEGK